jgi:hypothetical protein
MVSVDRYKVLDLKEIYIFLMSSSYGLDSKSQYWHLWSYTNSIISYFFFFVSYIGIAWKFRKMSYHDSKISQNFTGVLKSYIVRKFRIAKLFCTART